MAKKSAWSPDWAKIPKEYNGVAFNPDGMIWAWSEKPTFKGSEKRPNDLKWRGPHYGEGFKYIGTVSNDVLKRVGAANSYVERPK